MSMEFGHEPTNGRGLVGRTKLVVKQVGRKKTEQVEIPKALRIGGSKKRFEQHCITFCKRKGTLMWKLLGTGKQLKLKCARNRKFNISYNEKM